MSLSSSRMPGASISKNTAGNEPPRSGRQMKVSISPSLVVMSRVSSIMAVSAQDEVGTLVRLRACREVMDRLIATPNGRIFNTADDSVVADFASAVDAVQCAEALNEEGAGDPKAKQCGSESASMSATSSC